MKLTISESENLKVIYGESTYPYYIYTPRWIETSAGIKALHFLCHSLNLSGQKAFLVFSEKRFNNLPRVNPNLLTPILDQETADAHFKSGLTPLVVYSETVPGNPLGGTAVVRYLMNFAGALGGEKSFLESELVFAFSKAISADYSKHVDIEAPVLFLPPIDPRDFIFSETKEDYQVVYAGKYRSFIGIPPKVGFLKSFEVYRDGPRMQSREKVIRLLNKASVVYCFENTSIITEAILSGTPVCIVKSDFMTEVIAEHELGTHGTSKTLEKEDIEVARSTVNLGRDAYFKSIEKYSESLESFIKETQFFAFANGYENQIQIPTFNEMGMVTVHRRELAKQIYRNQGVITLIRVFYHFLARRLAWRYWLGR